MSVYHYTGDDPDAHAPAADVSFTVLTSAGNAAGVEDMIFDTAFWTGKFTGELHSVGLECAAGTYYSTNIMNVNMSPIYVTNTICGCGTMTELNSAQQTWAKGAWKDLLTSNLPLLPDPGYVGDDYSPGDQIEILQDSFKPSKITESVYSQYYSQYLLYTVSDDCVEFDMSIPVVESFRQHGIDTAVFPWQEALRRIEEANSGAFLDWVREKTKHSGLDDTDNWKCAEIVKFERRGGPL